MSAVVRRLPRYYGIVRLPGTVHDGRVASGVRHPDRCAQHNGQSQGLPGSVQKGSCACAGSLTPGARWPLARARPPISPSTDRRAWARSIENFRGSIAGLMHIPVNASRRPLPDDAHDSGPMWLARPSLQMMFQSTFLPAWPGAPCPMVAVPWLLSHGCLGWARIGGRGRLDWPGKPVRPLYLRLSHGGPPGGPPSPGVLALLAAP